MLYISSIFAVMTRKTPQNKTQVVEESAAAYHIPTRWVLGFGHHKYTWSSNTERVKLIREGISYQVIEGVGRKIDLPVKDILEILQMPQTTYNKKLREHSRLSSRDSELILMLSELIDYGIDVFNKEDEKFRRWLKKPNISLGNLPPESFLDSITGILEVRNCLNRIEYGAFA